MRYTGDMENNDIAVFTTILNQQLPLLEAQYGVHTLAIFGSYTRGGQRDASDLDVLVTFHQPPSLLMFLALEQHLTDLLGIEVDLVMRDALKPTIGKHILAEQVMV